jgi:hypothetical protein
VFLEPEGTELVLLDQQPLRAAAGAACTAVMARLEEVRAAWHRFEREDKPAFVRWRAREFGQLLSSLRDVEVQIRDRELLVHEVELEMRRGFFDPHTAYRRVMSRRSNGIPFEEPEPRQQQQANTSTQPRKLSEFEQEALFNDWVQKFMGTHPDKLTDEAYETSFEAFKTHMFRSAPPPPAPRPVNPRPVRIAEEEEDEQPDDPLDARVKEIYRLLVRRLHPDLRADGNAAASALWHEVQEAYAATDVAQLEILLALSGIESGRFGDETTVSQMRAIAAELERSLFALEDSLRQARGDDAWNFARAGAAGDLRLRVERELQQNLRRRTERLQLLKQTLAEWAQPPLASSWR